MSKADYSELFEAFGKAPIEDYIELLFDGIPDELKNRLVMEDLSYHRYSTEIVTLEAWMVVDSSDSNQWIWIQVEMNTASGHIKEHYYAKDSYSKQSLSSLRACLDYYRKTGK